MEIRQLKYFISVAETRSFSEASRQCFLSQSAISQQIKLLEDELGVKLFMRSTHSVMLTEQGEELLPMARQAIKSFDACSERIADMQGLICGQLNIGMTYTIEPYIRHTMIEMLRAYPNLRMNVYYKSTPELRRMLLNHEIDLAFNINKAGKSECIESTPILTYKLAAVMSCNHPLASLPMVTAADLKVQGLILPEKKDNALAIAYRYLQEDLSSMNVRAYINSPCAILNLLQDTNYVSVMTSKAVATRPGLVAKDIKELSEPIQCYAHHLKDVNMKKSAEVFMRVLREHSVPFCDSLKSC